MFFVTVVDNSIIEVIRVSYVGETSDTWRERICGF